MTLARLSQLVTATEALIICAIAPALLFPTPARLLVLIVVPLVWGCARLTTGRFVPSTPMNAALFVLLASVGISLYATFDIGFSLRKVSGVVLGVLLFWAITRWVTTAERLKTVVLLWVGAGAAFAAVALLGTDWSGEKFPLVGRVAALIPTVIRGLPGAEDGFNKNPVGGTLILFVPLYAALLAVGARRWLAPDRFARWPAGWTAAIVSLFLLASGTLVLTQSRGAWLSLGVAALVGLVWRRTGGRGVAVIATVVIAALASIGSTRLIDFALQHGGPDITGGVWMRVELWSRAIAVIQDVPLTGVGMDGFRMVMPIFYPTVLAPNLFEVHAHNHLLQAALDLGLPGLVAYMALWLVAGLLLTSVYRRSGEPVFQTLASGLGTGLLAHFLFGMTDAIPLGAKPGVFFWMTMALVVTLHRVAVNDPGWRQRAG